MAYSIVVAGSSKNTLICARALQNDQRFTIASIITPEPKPVGRQQEISKNTLHQWAEKENIETILVKKSLDTATVNDITAQDKPDFLLVVDFGYLIPNKLLQWPKIVPLNIHPSALPRWRGSAPGQFALLYGEESSAVTLIIMNDKLDQGPIVAQYSFTIKNNWNHADYYAFSFNLIAQKLANDLDNLAEGKITPQQQPLDSPTPIAKQLTKDEAFINWKTVTAAMEGETSKNLTSALLQKAHRHHTSTAELIEHAARALDPWPQLWTKIPTKKGPKRMKVLGAAAEKNQLKLKKVHIAGQKPAQWNQVKNILAKNAEK